MSDAPMFNPYVTEPTQQPPSQPHVASDSYGSTAPMRFARLALFTGGPLYWSTPTYTPAEHTHQLVDLLHWCLGLPGARVGINPQGIAQIIVSLIQSGTRQITDEIGRKLREFVLRVESTPQWPFDDRNWNDHWPRLIDWLNRSSTSELLWVTADEGGWWVEATGQSLLQYSALSLEPNYLLNLLGRHSCIVFGPYDDQATREHLVSLARERDRADIIQTLNESAALTDPRIASVCWSWNLLSFGNVGERSLVLTPELALWSDWPLSPIWAPPRPTPLPSSVLFTAQEAASFLEEHLWTTIETYFGLARSAVDLGISSPTFGGRQARSPVFYFAFPAEPPMHPEEYLSDRARAIQPITDRCLLAQDPVSDQVGWGILQGSVVTMRSETVSENAYALWYLLLPTLAKNLSAQQIEEIAGSLVGRLSYLEFSIGHEARDVSTDLEQYQNRRRLFAGSLDAVSSVIAQAIDLIPTVSRRLVGKINTSSPQLLRLMLRMQANAETVQSDTVQLQIQYQSYMDSTADFFRRGIPCSPLANTQLLSLRTAVLHAYPYAYIDQPLKSQTVGMNEVRDQIERTIEALQMFIEQAELHAREQLTRWGTLFASLIVVVTLLGTFSQIFSGTSEDSSQFVTWLNDIIPASLLESILHVLGVLALAAVLVTVVIFLVARLRYILPARPDRFVAHLIRYRTLVDQAVAVVEERATISPRDVGSRLEDIDSKSTEFLDVLWKEIIDISRSVRSSAFKKWQRRERRLEYSIQLFDLSPDLIPLPRTICILRFKSAELRRYSMIPDWDWTSFLNASGIGSDDARKLDEWLKAPVIAEQVSRMDVDAFARALKEHGVSADPELRTPDKWTGNLVPSNADSA